MDESIKRRLDAELKNLAAGSVFSIQDFSVTLSKQQLLSFLSPYLDQGEVSRVVPNIYYKVKFSSVGIILLLAYVILISEFPIYGDISNDVFLLSKR